MEYDIFMPQKGWIHFAFANEQDIYDLPSTVRVGYRTYLEYLLKKSGYEAIFFWDENNGQYILNFPDEKSSECYDKIRPKKWLLFGGETEKTSNNVKASRETIESVISSMGNCGTRIALVTSMRTFDSFCSDEVSAKHLRKMINRPRSSDSMLLLTAGTTASESNVYLTKKDGALQMLLEEVRQAASPGNKYDLYTALKKNMKERCMFLNDLSRERIKNMVSRNVLKWNILSDESYTEAIDAATEVIYKYYHSMDFRNKFAGVIKLPINERYELRKIDEQLKTTEFIENVKKLADEYQGYNIFQSVIEQKYADDINIRYICTNDFALNKWLDVSKQISKMDADNANELRMINRIDSLLRSIALRGNDSDDEESDENSQNRNMLYCIESIEKSASEWQRKYREYKIYAFNSYLEAVNNTRATEENWKNLYKYMLDAANEAQKYKRLTENYKKEIPQKEKEFQKWKRALDSETEGTPMWNQCNRRYKSAKSSVIRSMEAVNKYAEFEKSLIDMVSRVKEAIMACNENPTIRPDDMKNTFEILRNKAIELEDKKLEFDKYFKDNDADSFDSRDFDFDDERDIYNKSLGLEFGLDDEEKSSNHGFSEDELMEWFKS